MASLNSRFRVVKPSKYKGKCVLYVMSRDQRVRYNHALVVAQKTALDNKLPLAVVFCLLPKVAGRAREHHEFMIKGLKQVEAQLKVKNIPLIILLGSPYQTLPALIHHTRPHTVIFDFNPLNDPKKLVNAISQGADGKVMVVDTHNIVPLWQASDKQEVGARTLRPKIHRQLKDYLSELPGLIKHPFPWPGTVMTMGELDTRIDGLLDKLPRNKVRVIPSSGALAAHKAMNVFLTERLGEYHQNKNKPNLDGLSNLSVYLHFGQLSSLEVAQNVLKAVASNSRLQQGADAYLEELIVRKELSDNFCYYNNSYASLSGAPGWALKSLSNHSKDRREFTYTFKQFESAQTHDLAWNATQKQLTQTGKIHGYMRMYWAKKILEWTNSASDAHKIAVRLNDFYSWDGGDPNGYVGILWSLAGLHDRPWFDRPVYGKVRYMNYNGLKRKFDVVAYEKQWL